MNSRERVTAIISRDTLGRHLVVSPAHEGMQDDARPENIVAMAEAARD